MQKLKHETTPYHEAYRGQNIFLEIFSFEINAKEKDSENRFFFFQFKNSVLHEERKH